MPDYVGAWLETNALKSRIYQCVCEQRFRTAVIGQYMAHWNEQHKQAAAGCAMPEDVACAGAESPPLERPSARRQLAIVPLSEADDAFAEDVAAGEDDEPIKVDAELRRLRAKRAALEELDVPIRQLQQQIDNKRNQVELLKNSLLATPALLRLYVKGLDEDFN